MTRTVTADREKRSEAGRPSPTTGKRLTGGERRRQLFDVALTLFAEHGFTATTMDDIAEAAGVTKPLVYQHVDSKRALYMELMEVFAGELIERIVSATANAPGPRRKVELGMAAYFEMMVGNEESFRLLYGRNSPDDPELGDALRRVEDTLAEAIDPLIDVDLDPEHRMLLAYTVVGMVEGATRHWIVRRTDGWSDQAAIADEDPDEAARLATRVSDMAWAGLRQVHRV